MTNSIDTLAKLTVSPQTIPESQPVDHSIDQAFDLPPASLDGTDEAATPPADMLSRNTSNRSSRQGRSMRSANSISRRQSRRSTSYTSNSPAHAFLASWHREASNDTATAEVKPDDEGQAIGLNNEYIIGRTINTGAFGVVKEVRTMNEKTGQQEAFAVKIVRKPSQQVIDNPGDEADQQDLEHEVSIWRHLVHPTILQLRAVYDTNYATFCVMDLNSGYTLFDIVRKRRESHASEDDRDETGKALEPHLARSYAYQLASALRYLHEDIRVCHRDVKLENCLIDNTSADYEKNGGLLRLCDFGLADFLSSGSIDGGSDPAVELTDKETTTARLGHRKQTSSVIGTLEYASPRGLSANRKLFETAGDVWAYGVIVYALCTGDLPFRHPMPSKTVDAILRADWDDAALRRATASGVGEEIVHLVQGCLEKDIDLRWTIGDCIASPWFDGLREQENDKQTRTWMR